VDLGTTFLRLKVHMPVCFFADAGRHLAFGIVSLLHVPTHSLHVHKFPQHSAAVLYIYPLCAMLHIHPRKVAQQYGARLSAGRGK